MALQPACDVNMWIPPTPAAVLSEAGYTAPLAGVGSWAPIETYGWNCQTYLAYATAGIVQTYSEEAPVEEPQPEPEPEPSPGRSAKNSNGKTAKAPEPEKSSVTLTAGEELTVKAEK
jgi:hypothetical protein